MYRLQRYFFTKLKPCLKLLWSISADRQTEQWLIVLDHRWCLSLPASETGQCFSPLNLSGLSWLTFNKLPINELRAQASSQTTSYYSYPAHIVGVAGMLLHLISQFRIGDPCCLAGIRESDEKAERCPHTHSVHWWGDVRTAETPTSWVSCWLHRVLPFCQTNRFWK